MEISQRFFLQPEEVKRASSRGSFPESGNHGWVSLELERWARGSGLGVLIWIPF